jgi:hypothetical protein
MTGMVLVLLAGVAITVLCIVGIVRLAKRMGGADTGLKVIYGCTIAVLLFIAFGGIAVAGCRG